MKLGGSRPARNGPARGLTLRTVMAGAALALIVGGAFAVLLASIGDLRDARLREQRSAEVLTLANRLERLIIDMETGQRGFALTGEASFLQPWQAAIDTFPGQASAMERLVAGIPAERALAEKITAAGGSYIDDYSVPLVAALRRDPGAGESGRRAPGAAGTARAEEGKRRVDALRADFDALVTAALGSARAEQRRSDAAAQRATAVGVAGLIASVVLIGAYSHYLARAVVAPVRRLAGATRQLADGDLQARVPERGAGEIGVLQRGFNTMAATLSRQRSELAASRSRIVASADQARRRIERDLHDGIQQRLVSLVLEVRAIQATSPPDRPELAEPLDRLADALGEAVDELREISRGIHPAILSEAGLGPALKALARRSPVPVELDVEVPGRLPEPVEVAAYYVVSEALTNTAKHARASVATVRARLEDGRLRLRVRDDGAGGATASGSGSGLLGLADRVEALGGTVRVDSPPGQGTTLDADLPVTGG
ncbi:CHASE3 domain-containing protein [Nonomuraea composti]|uniref:CHASE3 domain-containing protein n=1 Tax=Nonomuraea composti TaxID=2720023 RepID=UPI00197D41F4|nr:CHASE3 domain-containing protein [Nonomuraea sp. FMUSA5-5]